MSEFLFLDGGYSPHGYCLAWEPMLLGLHVGANAAIALAYLVIPLAIWQFVRRRRDLPKTSLPLLFCAFILLCGATHAVSILTMFQPLYGLEGVLKAATGVVSLATAVICFRLLPRLLALPGHADLVLANLRLEREVAARTAAEAELRAINADIEREIVARSRELRESEERYALAVDASLAGIWDWNIQTGDVVFSDRTRELLGYDREEFPEKLESWLDALHPDDRDVVLAAVDRHFTTRERYEAVYRIRAADGSWRWWRSRGRATFGADGHALRMLGTNHDITDEKLREEALIEAQRQAQQASIAKSTFLATMSHEIRTPMNGIIGFADLLARDELAPRQRVAVETIADCGQALLGLIDDLLDFSKIEAGKVEIASEPFSVLEEVERICCLLHASARKKGIDLVFDCDPSLTTPLRGDAGRLRQVLTNLVGNAIKYTSAGEVVVSAEAAWDGPLCHVTLSVADTGPGIAPDQQTRIFNPFVRAPHHIEEQSGGTGLGLAISRSLMELMGGSLDLVTELGKGSVFTCRLSLRQADAVDPVGTEPDARGAWIGVVATSDAWRRQCLRSLEAWGYRAVGATSLAALEGLIARSGGTGSRPEPAAVIARHPGTSGGSRGAAAPEGPPGRFPQSLLAGTPLLVLGTSGGGDTPATDDDASEVVVLPEPIRSAALRRTLAQMISGAPAPLAGRSVAARAAEEVTLANLAELRVLVADDVATNRLVVKGMLEGRVRELIFAEDGAGAVELYRLHEPDVVLMDVAMPILDGVAATRMIRELDPGASCTVIGLTAHAMKSDLERFRAAGMDDVLVKPLQMERLLERIARAGRGDRGSRRIVMSA